MRRAWAESLLYFHIRQERGEGEIGGVGPQARGRPRAEARLLTVAEEGACEPHLTGERCETTGTEGSVQPRGHSEGDHRGQEKGT